MTAEQFAWWLQGFMDVSLDDTTTEQWKRVKAKLSRVEGLGEKFTFAPGGSSDA